MSNGELAFVRWRLNDPAEGPYRWTKVHATPDADVTLCGIRLPEHPYMAEVDDSSRDLHEIPKDAEPCERCRRKAAGRLGLK